MTKRKPTAEVQGYEYVRRLIRHIQHEGGIFLRDDDGSLHVAIGGRRIPLKISEDNRMLASLMLDACHVSTLSQAAKVAIQRLHVEANKVAGGMKFRRFSALSEDGTRLYIPLADGQLCRITAQNTSTVPNGKNEDSIWLEHPQDEPLRHTEAEPRNGLADFERLLVDPQACQTSEMKWFTAMHEGLFPYIRDACPARMLAVHIGPTQQGKTSGAQRFTLLHGLGAVKGDYSVAALGNIGDIGLLVMDNVEQANLNQGLIDFCLHLATGAERGRSFEDGRVRVNRFRPVGVITTIEGVYKAELRTRCVDIHYAVTGQHLPRAPIEREIRERRHGMLYALTHVLRRYMEINSEPTIAGECPVPEFEEHYLALCNLLRAYAYVASKPEGWAEAKIEVWQATFSGGEPEEDELEHPLYRIIFEPEFADQLDRRIQRHEITYKDRPGILCVTECGQLLSMLQELGLRDRQFPKTPQGLSRRLRSAKFRSFTFLEEESAPELPMLRRTAKSRPIGFFRER